MGSRTIIHVTQSLGGVETYLMTFLEHGAFDGFEHRILVVPERTPLADAWESRGGSVVIVRMQRSLNMIRDVRAVIKLRRIFKKNPAATVHLHSSKAGALGRVASMFLGRSYRPDAVVYTPHAFYFLALKGVKRSIFVAIERLLAFATDVLLATSPSEANRAIKDVGFKASKVACVPNAVRIVDGERKRNRNGIFEIIFVGRVCYQKNIDLLLGTVRLFSLLDEVHFTLVGTGHYADDRRILEEAIVRECVDRRLLSIVDWMPREELMKRYALADLCILTSRYESFGYVVAEANAVGTPVIATDVDGVRDIVEDGCTGLLIGDGEPQSFYNSILHLKRSRALLEEMGKKARQRIEAKFDIDINSKQLAEFYRIQRNVAA